MRRYVVLEKKVGETPLAALRTWVSGHPEYAQTPAAYAGRLDPMASGKLLILLGEECKRQSRYHGLDKEYDVELLLDVGSDTGDALGLVASDGTRTKRDDAAVAYALSAELGTHERAYPAYSSKTVAGKPLFLYALTGTLDTIDLPTHAEHVYSIRQTGVQEVRASELRSRIDAFLSRVPRTDEESKALGADFRVDAVRQSWNELFARAGERSFLIVRIRVAVKAGAYMRTLAPRIGRALGTDAIALSIHRRKIGKHMLGLWKTY